MNVVFNNKVLIPESERTPEKYKRHISVRFLLRAMQEISFYCDVDGLVKRVKRGPFSQRARSGSYRRPGQNVIKNSESILLGARNKIVLLALEDRCRDCLSGGIRL